MPKVNPLRSRIRSTRLVSCFDRFDIRCAGTISVLEAAAQAGLTLPSSCREGACGTCKTRLISGQVDMDHTGGIRPREIAQGQILLCCSTPTTDLVVDA